MPLVCTLTLLLQSPLLSDDEGPLPAPGMVWAKENWSWEFSIPLFLLLSWYLIGALHRGRQTAIGRRHIAFSAGWLALFLALISPLHRLGDVLFSAHMLQHEIILLVAAPLFAASQPAVTMLYALSRGARPSVGKWCSRTEQIPFITLIVTPLSAFLLHAAALWLWHIPSLYQATLDSDFIHALQHLSFFLSGVLFWSALYGAGRATMTYGAGVLYVFGTAIHSAGLGALLTFSSVLWYPIYAGRTQLWHLTPLQDQQLGGLLMWVPSGIVFIVIGIWMFARWLATSEQRVKQSTLAGFSAAEKEHA
jgi:putative membrane protein